MKDSNNINTIPIVLDSILDSDASAMDYFIGLDVSGRNELIHYANDFESKEELEHYLYYAMHDNYKDDFF